MNKNRIKLRRFNESDLDDLHEYASTPGLGEMAGWGHHRNLEQSKIKLEFFINDDHVYAIEMNKKLIGSICLHDSWAQDVYPKLSSIEIGFELNKNYWGMGIALEATNILLKHCFIELNKDVVTICHFITNTQSKRVIEKAGFTYVRDDMYRDIAMESQYIMYKEDFIIS